jgi:hypothetical protein
MKKKLIKEEKENPKANSKSVLQKLVHAKDDETNFSFSDERTRKKNREQFFAHLFS